MDAMPELQEFLGDDPYDSRLEEMINGADDDLCKQCDGDGYVNGQLCKPCQGSGRHENPS